MPQRLRVTEFFYKKIVTVQNSDRDSLVREPNFMLET